MIPVFKEREFDEQPLRCDKCQWSGKGYEAVVIGFYGVSDQKEAHCPDCDKKLAIVEKDNDPPPGESANDLSFQFG